ncbi:hypothetical protein BC332_25300 [Capsicum chinense]|nr:hypothetical protein BC332_25300 [Capsicum chinense]
MAELVTLISKIPVEVIKTLKNEENKQSQDVNAANKEAGHEDNFENEDFSDLQALEDEVGGTITDLIQAAVDIILFDLSTPSTTKSFDVGSSNKMTERHWDLPDSQILPNFPDAQVRELQASNIKAPAKQERKKSMVLRSPYISKYGSDSKDAVDFDKEEKLKYALMAKLTVELSTQQDYAESIVVAKNENAIANIIQEFCMPAGLPWYMVDEVYIPINYDNGFYDKTEQTDRPSLEAYKGKITQQTGLVNEIPFDVDYVQNIPKQPSDSL